MNVAPEYYLDGVAYFTFFEDEKVITMKRSAVTFLEILEAIGGFDTALFIISYILITSF